MAPTIEQMVKRDFASVLDFVHEMLHDIHLSQWGSSTAVADMWVRFTDPARPSNDLEGYVLDRLVNWDCVKLGDAVPWVIDGVSRAVTVLYVTDTGFQLAGAIEDHKRSGK